LFAILLYGFQHFCKQYHTFIIYSQASIM